MNDNTEGRVAHLHVPVQFFQQRWVPLQPGEGFTQTGGQSQDPGSGRPLCLHVLPQLLTVMHTNTHDTVTHLRNRQVQKNPSLTVPVLNEYIDSRWVVGAVGHIEELHLGHQIEEEAPDPLLLL